jgi:hypothetical protein
MCVCVCTYACMYAYECVCVFCALADLCALTSFFSHVLTLEESPPALATITLSSKRIIGPIITAKTQANSSCHAPPRPKTRNLPAQQGDESLWASTRTPPDARVADVSTGSPNLTATLATATAFTMSPRSSALFVAGLLPAPVPLPSPALASLLGAGCFMERDE